MDLRATPLTEIHRDLGATMVPFAGYEMPMSYNQYSGGTRKEHLFVRESCGLFDVSHMGELLINGARAAEFLSFATTRSASKMKPSRAQYCLLLNETGTIVDDVLIYKESDTAFLMVVNAANKQKDWEHLKNLASQYEVSLKDVSDETSLIALQGPRAKEIIKKIEPSLADLKYYSFAKSGHWTVARTGYTGEDGFEIFLPNQEAAELWRGLMKQGAKPIGLGARDTLRMEVGFALYGQELSEELLGHETCSAFAIAKDGDFLGAPAIRENLPRYRPIGLLGNSPKPFRQGDKLYLDGKEVGWVTSGTTSPSLKRGMGLALLNLQNTPSELAEGEIFLLESGPKERQAVLTNFPFVETERSKKRKSK